MKEKFPAPDPDKIRKVCVTNRKTKKRLSDEEILEKIEFLIEQQELADEAYQPGEKIYN